MALTLQDRAPAPVKQQPSGAPTNGLDLVARKNSPDAARVIDGILNGTEPAVDLAALFSALDESTRSSFIAKRMGELQAFSGDDVLEVVEALSAPARQAIEAVFAGTRPPTSKRLVAYMRQMNGPELGQLTDGDVTKARAVLSQPLLMAVPAAIVSFDALAEKRSFLEWLVETASSDIVAQLLSSTANEKTAGLLDSFGGWGWLDKLSARDVTPGVRQLASRSSVDTVHQRWRVASAGADRAIAAPADKILDSEDIAALASNPSVTLDALVRAVESGGRMSPRQVSLVLPALKRLGVTAAEVLRLQARATIPDDSLFKALLDTADLTSERLVVFIAASHWNVQILVDSTSREQIRLRLPGFRARELLLWAGSSVASVLLSSDGLRRWFFEDCTPQDLLELCASSASAAERMIRIVGKELGFAWVRELPRMGEGRDTPLRVFALHCHDAPTVRFVRAELMTAGEPPDPHVHTAVTAGALPVDPQTRTGAAGRLLDSLADVSAGADDTMVRLADLDGATRARVGDQREVVAAIAKRVGSTAFTRAAYLLDLSFENAVRASLVPSPALVAYVHSRPQSEEIAVLRSAELVERAAKYVHANLLVVFPALAEPRTLAALLERDANALPLLLAGSDPTRVVELLAREPVLSIALARLEAAPELLAQLPRFADLNPRARAAVERLRHSAPAEGDVVMQLDQLQRGDIEPGDRAAAQGAHLRAAERDGTLAERLDHLADRAGERSERTHAPEPDGERASGVNAIALLEAHKSEVSALLFDRRLWPTVERLAKLVQLAPDVAIPWIGIAELLQMPNAVFWWLGLGDRAAFLRLLSVSAAGRRLVGEALDAGHPTATRWLELMPAGAALDRGEQLALDALRASVAKTTSLRLVFAARFGFPAPAELAMVELSELYAIASRLPPAQLDQHRIAAIVQTPIKPAAGQWDPETKSVDLDPDTLVRDPATGDQKEGTELYPADLVATRTRAEMTDLYGLDDAELARRVERHEVEVVQAEGVDAYRVQAHSMGLFEQVLLHEFGHSVDEILGLRTAPVWDFAGWREYDLDGFDEWAAEMGGWEHVSPDDRVQIRTAWIDAIHARVAVSVLVEATHPARAAKYQGRVGIVGLAEQVVSGEHRAEVAGRVFVTNLGNNRLYSLAASAAHTAPSSYALTAPGEYFAESYVEYYRGVDGKPGSAGTKGGMLPSPVKKWFDENVDKLEYDPHRFEKPAEE